MSTSTLNGATAGQALDDALSRNSRADEQAVLGAMMSARGELSHVPGEVRELLRPPDGTPGVGEHHFTAPINALIYKMLIELADAGEALDPLAVMARMPVRYHAQLGNGAYLSTCLERCLDPGNGAGYARNVAHATLLRNLAQQAAATAQQVLAVPLAEAPDFHERVRTALDALAVPGARNNMVSWGKAGADAFDEMQRLHEVAQSPKATAGMFSTGWSDLDRLLGSPGPGTVIVIAGRPGLGKSVMARNIAQHLAMRKKLGVLFFSMEMSRLEISIAMMAAGARLHKEDIKHGRLSDDDWVDAARYLGETADAPLMIDDTPGGSLAHYDRALAAYRRQHGEPPVAYVVDYLQLAEERSVKAQGRQVEVSAMSRGHKLLAKKHGTVCILLSQLNRGPEGRTDKRPQLSDLRESGSIEQDADVVILLHRDDYYDKESPRAGEADFIVAKHRNGPTDTVTVAAQLHLSRFVDMAIC